MSIEVREYSINALNNKQSMIDASNEIANHILSNHNSKLIICVSETGRLSKYLNGLIEDLVSNGSDFGLNNSDFEVTRSHTIACQLIASLFAITLKSRGVNASSLITSSISYEHTQKDLDSININTKHISNISEIKHALKHNKVIVVPSNHMVMLDGQMLTNLDSSVNPEETSEQNEVPNYRQSPSSVAITMSLLFSDLNVCYLYSDACSFVKFDTDKCLEKYKNLFKVMPLYHHLHRDNVQLRCFDSKIYGESCNHELINIMNNNFMDHENDILYLNTVNNSKKKKKKQKTPKTVSYKNLTQRAKRKVRLIVEVIV